MNRTTTVLFTLAFSSLLGCSGAALEGDDGTSGGSGGTKADGSGSGGTKAGGSGGTKAGGSGGTKAGAGGGTASGGTKAGTGGGTGSGGTEVVEGGAAGAGGAVSTKCDGTIVSSPDYCVQDGGRCEPLGDGTYCTQGTPPDCSSPATVIGADDTCPAGYICYQDSGALRCKIKTYTLDQCAAAGGTPKADPGDGSLTPAQCPTGTALGRIDADWDEGGLCCGSRACGARAGDTCSDDEFCAYEPSGICGHADAEAVCKPRPGPACIELYAPVCGCDGVTYDNSCFANAAGTGLLSAGPCAN